MADVDPFNVPVPRVIAQRVLPVDWTPEDMTELFEWWIFHDRHHHDLWVRSGGGNDALEDVVDVIQGDDPGDTVTFEDDPPVWNEETNDWD